jgi:hypothetical protein
MIQITFFKDLFRLEGKSYVRVNNDTGKNIPQK